MGNNISYTPIFEKHFKKFSKKHRSLANDLSELSEILLENPKIGVPLGDDLYKIRLAVKSKNKGKSGGFRIITYLLTNDNKSFNINLLTLYDKSEVEDIAKEELLKIVKKNFH